MAGGHTPDEREETAMSATTEMTTDTEKEPRSRKSRVARLSAVALGVVMAGTGAYAATNWVVGLSSGSSGEGQSATISNLTISAIASPSATNDLYPGGNGDVVVTIDNTNTYPVTITALQLPTNTTYAAGFTTSALTTAQSGCSATTSDVIWNYSSATSGSSHTLATPLTVAASSSLVVTFTNDASMTLATPLACANTFFSMPSLTGVTATGGAATPTASPTTDSWTS
jgi:hypothetical protein